MGQRPERLDWQGDFHGKNQVGLPRILGRTNFGLHWEIEKRFSDFDSRNDIQI
jgi:hypothetical protein